MASSDSDWSSVYPNLQSTTSKTTRSSHDFESTTSSRPSKKVSFVYATDLPCHGPVNEIESSLRTRLETTFHITISNVKYYPAFGIAVIRVSDETQKHRLVHDIQVMVLENKKGAPVSFLDNLELESYIVLDQSKEDYPSAEEVVSQFMNEYQTWESPTCQSISTQFSNIFRLIPSSFDELVQAANSPTFQINNIWATFYPLIEMSLFEDLPRNISDKKLRSAIVAQIKEKDLPENSLYVQYNKANNTAIALVAKSVKDWRNQDSVNIGGRNIPKKSDFSYTVLVYPVPDEYSVNFILNHRVFKDHVVTHQHNNDQLIITLDNVESYDTCLAIPTLKIKNQSFNITPCSDVHSSARTNEVNSDTWYDRDMLQMKPDIMAVIHNHDHPMFHYSWDARAWLEQFQKSDRVERRSKGYDTQRHLLRVTVMLNTIGIVRKKQYMVNNEEVMLKPKEPMKTTLYNHQSKLVPTKTISLSEMKGTFPATSVRVVNEDCLVVYKDLVLQGHRPLLLNMANADKPGGGYRKGDGAQEENLFRRSDYYQSLDIEVADQGYSERLYCTATGQCKPLDNNARLYPMDLFGAIYTSGLTVFRETEDKGYALMKEPLYNVCSIAMAANRNPALKDNKTLTDDALLSTRKKLENVFAIAHFHKHDVLVLSAFGCGAFKNPPGHVASIFKSVISQYAGYFDAIYFAIVDDHNTGQRLNPDGNILPFQEVFAGFNAKPSTNILVDAIYGPHHILKKVNDDTITVREVIIDSLPLCRHGARCNDLHDTKHIKAFSHPSMCPFQNSTSPCDQLSDDVHLFTFVHNAQCSLGGQCNNKDPKHLNDYEHPDLCPSGVRCQDTHPEHLFRYRHLETCVNGFDCLKYQSQEPEHCKSYRHFKTVCPYDNCCFQFHNKTHMENAIHTFRPPCPFTPYNCQMYVAYVQKDREAGCSQEIESHCRKFSHVCLYGRQCKNKEQHHFENNIHIARQLCSDLDRCPKLAHEDHLESFSHPKVRDIRLFCNYPGFACRNKSERDHLIKYRHGRNHDHVSAALVNEVNTLINYVQNQGQMVRLVNDYVRKANWQEAPIRPEVLDWIRALQPIHRCSKDIFESILVHGQVMSRDYMNELKKSTSVANAVSRHSRVRLIFLKHNNPGLKSNATKLIEVLVQAEFEKAKSKPVPSSKHAATTDDQPTHDYEISRIEKKLKPGMSDEDIQVIRNRAIQIAQASIKLHENPMGIGYGVDQCLGTDKHVFSILGPHLGHYYGDIIILFKPEIMLHPDANFSIQAGTSFGPSKAAYQHRPWLTDPGTTEKRTENFHSSKLHRSVPRYEYAAAAELIALTGMERKTMDVTRDDILARWMKVDSHQVFEGHLPPLIPLDYIETVYMAKNVFDSLSAEAQRSAKGAFKHSLIITPHQLDLSLLVPGKTVPLDATRQAYQNFVLDKVSEKIDQRIATPSSARGTVMTIAASRFEQQIATPMTISQAFMLYRLEKHQSKTAPDETYIYWQAMNGDMMLVISQERINLNETDESNFRGLICYVAKIPSTASDDYHEEYSYLNVGHPYEHDANVPKAAFKAKSNRFYQGCKIDDFLTFCLKISHRTGEVILSHVGPNSIYNYETIRCSFKKNELDLSRIDYVHVSAGNEDVPIRNLTINFEILTELYPSVDKAFKLDTTFLLPNHPNPAPYVSSGASAALPHKPHRKQSPPRSDHQPVKEKEKKKSFFGRLLGRVFNGSSKDDNDVEEKESASAAPYSKPIKSKLTPCQDSVYCLNLTSPDHIAKYSHPCRFNELCRNKANEPHLTHEPHNVPNCTDDEECTRKDDPVHRAQCRHTNFPDYLVSCHYQESCRDRSSKHRIKYFHGEPLPNIKSKRGTSSMESAPSTRTRLIPCKYGRECRSMKNPQHTAKYSHPN